MALRAMERGAFTFLEKPPIPQNLLRLINQAFELHSEKRKQKEFHDKLVQQLNSLTKAELGVAQLVAKGFSNQKIADILEVSVHTVKNQKIQIYSKLDVINAVELADFFRETKDAINKS